MSASKSDRLGRNPFDRGTYAASTDMAPKTSKPKVKTKSKSKKAIHDPRKPQWRLLLNKLDRRAPQVVRDLKICKRVASLAEFAAERLNAVARHLA